MKKNGNDNLEEEKKQLEKRLKEIKEEEKKNKKKIRGRVQENDAGYVLRKVFADDRIWRQWRRTADNRHKVPEE